MTTKLITNAIAYVNGPPHLGHTVGLLHADVLARRARHEGHEVRFTTGADENSLKNVRAAEAAGVPTRELVDINAAKFARLDRLLSISSDHFVRTTDALHHARVADLWRACAKDLYRRTYRGLYCVGCEQFLDEPTCPEHEATPEVVEEENWFFALSKYEAEILRAIDSGDLAIRPEKHRRAVRAFVAGGLKDISVSRSVERARGWGVVVPDDVSQVIYVWFDALANYLTSDPEFWSRADERIHVIGKGITRFHAVYWPAILLSAGLPLPTEIFVHDYITVEGQKIGKSLDNVVDPDLLIETYGAEALRYYVLRHLKPTKDCDFGRDRLVGARNNELADRLGNLLSRTTSLAARHGLEPGPRREVPATLDAVFDLVDDTNRYIDSKTPWRLEGAARAEVIGAALGALATIGEGLGPYLPDTSARIEHALRVPIVAAPPLFAK